VIMASTTGTFTVAAFEPQPHDLGVTTGLPTGYVLMRKEFSGGIEGWARTQFCYAFDDATGVGTYVALESFTGTIDGRRGTCNIAHQATTTGADDRSGESVVIVPGSGTDDLAGIEGTGAIVVDPDGTHRLTLEHNL